MLHISEEYKLILKEKNCFNFFNFFYFVVDEFVKTISMSINSAVYLIRNIKTKDIYVMKFVDKKNLVTLDRESKMFSLVSKCEFLVDGCDIVHFPDGLGFIMKYFPKGDLLEFRQKNEKLFGKKVNIFSIKIYFLRIY
jgi:hypothetical protein